MKTIKFFFISAVSTLFLAGCGLFLGPLPQISLIQKLSSTNWTKIMIFENNPMGTPDYKGTFFTFKQDNVFYNYFAFKAGSASYISEYTSSNTPSFNFLTIEGTVNNLFDLDESSSQSFIFTMNYNSNFIKITPPMNTTNSPLTNTTYNPFSYFFLADNQIVGLSAWISIIYADFTTGMIGPTLFTDPGASSLSVVKARNKYNNQRVFAIVSEYMAMSTSIQIVSMSSPMAPLLNTSIPGPSMTTFPIFIESDGNQLLYLIIENGLYRYDLSTKSLVLETSAGKYDAYLTKMLFINENLLIFTLDNNSFKTYIYNTGTKSMSTVILPVTDATNINSFDAYYDKSDDKIYINYVTVSNMSIWSGYTLIND